MVFGWYLLLKYERNLPRLICLILCMIPFYQNRSPTEKGRSRYKWHSLAIKSQGRHPDQGNRCALDKLISFSILTSFSLQRYGSTDISLTPFFITFKDYISFKKIQQEIDYKTSRRHIYTGPTGATGPTGSTGPTGATEPTEPPVAVFWEGPISMKDLPGRPVGGGGWLVRREWGWQPVWRWNSQVIACRPAKTTAYLYPI